MTEYIKNKVLERPKSNSKIDRTLDIQLEKLLKDSEIKNKYKKKLTSWIEEFQIFLNTLPIHNAIYISNFSKKPSNRPSRDMKFVKNITSHARNNLHCDKDIPITFIRPESVGTFGLYKIDALPGPNIEINLHMTIPKKCFKDNDFLNNRYFVKKFYYLMYLAEHLYSQNICSVIKCAYYYENVLLPYLILCPNSTEKIRIKIFLIPEQNNFDLTRFAPEVNNLKAQLFEEEIGCINNIGEFGTSFYNTAIAFDVSLAENNVFIEEIFSNSINMQNGLKLIVIWMNRRELDTGLDAFSRDLALYILVYLISRKTVNNNMTYLQIFRRFLYFMNSVDLTRVPISICDKISEDALQIYKKSFDIVLMDKTGCYNTAAFLNIDAYLKMKNDCKMALNNLNQHNTLSFSDLFLENTPLYLQYDTIIDVKHDNNYEFLIETVNERERTKYSGYHMLLIIKILQRYLKNSFDKKLLHIVPILPGSSGWDYGVRHKISNGRILFGIQLNPDFAQNIPEWNQVSRNSAQKRFKKFWGNLDSYRYPDNPVDEEGVFFQIDTKKGQRSIIKSIVDDVMTTKLNLNYKLYYNELEDFLMCENEESWYPSGTNEETTLKIIGSAEGLGQKIRSLNISPEISGIGFISDVFCFTKVFPPIPTSYTWDKKNYTLNGNNIVFKDEKLNIAPRFVEPIECVIKLANHPNTPADSKILQYMNTTFLVQISKRLKNRYNIISSMKPLYLDVLFEGIVFRYYVYSSNEVYVWKKYKDSSNSKFIEEREMCLQMEKKLIVIPKIVEELKGINVRFPSYGVSTCLAKRWIRAQLIDDFLLPDMVINLLNAHQYLHQSLYDAAVAPQVAFIRFLKFWVELKWDSQPVVINFNNELTNERISEFQTEMLTNRKSYPTLFILTPYDNGNSIFTKKAPCKEVLNRMKVLATEFLNYVKNIILEESLYSWKELFIPNRRGFHCILNLKPLLNPRRHNLITGNGINSKVIYTQPKQDDSHIPVINFDPVQIYLRELRTTYGDFCVFFHDTYGGNYIGVLWKPDAVESKEGIKKGFEILGRDILKSIDMKTE